MARRLDRLQRVLLSHLELTLTTKSMPSATSSSSSSSTSLLDNIPTSYAVIDVGAHSLRISIGSFDSSSSQSSRQDLLSSIQSCPNAIARARQASATSSDRRTFIGSSILTHCSDYASLILRLPQEKGFITDWQAQKAVWDRELAINPEIQKAINSQSRSSFISNPNSKEKEKDGPKLLEGRLCIITETVFNLPDLEENLETMLFDEYGAAAVWRCSAPQLVPYSEIFTSTSTKSSAPVADVPEADISIGSNQAMSKLERWRSRGRAKGKKTSGITRGNNDSPPSTRPECMLIVDLGHSASHAVPMYKDDVLWDAVRRLSVGGKLLTNLLKETLSFRQWDMMDETWLVGAVKERCCFVAPGGKGSRKIETRAIEEGRKKKPSVWDESDLREMCKGKANKNPILQEYVLPDYSYATDSSVPLERKYGYVRAGPGSDAANEAAELRERERLTSQAAKAREQIFEQDTSMIAEVNATGNVTDAQDISMVDAAQIDSSDTVPPSSAQPQVNNSSPTRGDLRNSLISARKQEEEKAAALAALDSFIADASALSEEEELGEEEDDDDDEDDEDFEEGQSDREDENRARKKQKKSQEEVKAKAKASQKKSSSHQKGQDEDDEQVLIMSNERFSVPEVLFAPNQIGLAQSPLPELIASSISAAPEEMRGPLWGNIVLVGGTSKLPGMKERLEKDLRALAPSDFDVKLIHPENPELIATLGALHLLDCAHSFPNSTQAKLLRSRVTTRAEWDAYGIGASRAKSGTWSSLALSRGASGDLNPDGRSSNHSGILPMAIVNSLRGVANNNSKNGTASISGGASGLEFRQQSLTELDPFAEVLHKVDVGSRGRRFLDRQQR